MPKTKVQISVIVAIYNTEKYLEQCIESILTQNFNNFELILVDDGSTDGSLSICNHYAKSDKRVKVIHQENSGQVKARKVGLQASVGEYIFFVDSDDWLEPKALKIISKELIKNNADIVTFDAYFRYSNRCMPVHQSIPTGYFDKQGLMESVYPKMIDSGRFFYFGIYAAMWNKVFRRSIVVPNMINVNEKIKIGEDGVTTFAAFLDAKKVCYLGGQYLYNYRDNNPFSMTRSYCPEQFDNAKLLIEELRKINKIKNVYDLTPQIDNYLMYNVYSIFLEEFYYKYSKNYSKRFKYLRKISSDKDVRQIALKIDKSNMEFKFKKFFGLLTEGKINRLLIFTIYLAMRKRLKIWVQKISGRY